MLLITGTQRVGSSLLAEFIKRCGYRIEGDNDAVGAHDDLNISINYRYILNDASFPWSNYPIEKAAIPLPALETLDYEVAKWPFLMMHPKLMQIWIDKRGNKDKLLILVREAEKVFASKRNTPERAQQFDYDSPILQQTPEQLKQNWFDCFMLLLNSGIEYRIMKFPNYTRDFNSIYHSLFTWGGLDAPPDCEDIWNDTFDQSKITAG